MAANIMSTCRSGDLQPRTCSTKLGLAQNLRSPRPGVINEGKAASRPGARASAMWGICSAVRKPASRMPGPQQQDSSPLRGLSPRPYAYGAHALPAELRRHAPPGSRQTM